MTLYMHKKNKTVSSYNNHSDSNGFFKKANVP